MQYVRVSSKVGKLNTIWLLRVFPYQEKGGENPLLLNIIQLFGINLKFAQKPQHMEINKLSMNKKILPETATFELSCDKNQLSQRVLLGIEWKIWIMDIMFPAPLCPLVFNKLSGSDNTLSKI